MPSPSTRPLAHSQSSGAPLQAPGIVIDPAFTAPDFDVKAWINATLNAALNQQDSSIPSNNITPPSSQSTLANNATTSNGPLRTSASSTSIDNTDASLDASLDLLQTPALDPVLDGPKNQDDQDALTTSSTSLATRKQSISTAESTSKSQNAILTQHATSQLTKLHLLAGQTTAVLSATTQDMVKLLPRLTHELDQLRQETKTLQEGIRLVRGDINSVEPSDTTQALDRLKYLDLVKTRMEATHSALREAENWRNLEAEAKDIFAKGDFTRAATRLSEAEKSLVVYKNTNVEGDRMALLLVLKDQLQQQVMDKVREAIEQKDTAACQTLINVFGLIGRQEVFQECYISQRREPLMQQWKRLMEAMNVTLRGSSHVIMTTTQAHTEDSKDFVNALQTFYKAASNTLHDEFSWITSIFSDPSAIIHSLVHDIFSNIDPTMQTALQHVYNTQGDEGSLPILISAFAATESFGTRMERIVSQPLVGNQREHSGNRPRAGTLVQDVNSKDGKGAAHFSRSKSPLGLDPLEIGSIHDPHEWAFILYEPFMNYQRDYGKLEGAHLKALLSKTIPSMAPYRDNIIRNRELAKSSSNLVKIMANTNSLAISLAEGAIGRCMRLTHGFGVPGLLDGLNDFFKDIMDRYTEILLECRQRSGLQVGDSASKDSKQNDYGRGARQSSKYENMDDDEGEDSEGWDEDMNEQDHRHLQMGLRLMDLCRQLCLKLEQLDLKTKRALRGVEELIKLDRTTQDSVHQGSHHHNSSSSEYGFSGPGLKSTTPPPNASIALLQQSNLNSFRLSEILDIVKKSEPKEDRAVITGDGSHDVDRPSAETDPSLEPKSNHLFLQSHQRAVHLTRLCQRFIFDSIYIPLVCPLTDLASLPCWIEGIDQQSQADDVKGARRIHQSTMGGTRTDVIKFRSSPSGYMEELLRQLLELPITFGMYEDDEGLRFGIHMLPYTDRPYELSHHPDSTEQVAGADASGIDGDDDKVLGVGEAASGVGAPVKEEAGGPEELETAEEDDLAVMHRWITSLSKAAMNTMIERLYNPNLEQTKSSTASLVTNIPPTSQRGRLAGTSSPSPSSAGKERQHLTRLSDAGAKQLELDLGYFVETCLQQLAVEPTPNIRALIKALRLSDSGLSMALQQIQQQIEEYKSSEQGSKSKRSSTLLESQQASMVIPGAPVLPSVLVVAEEDVVGQLELEQKVLEWVARLKRVDIPTS
ncbi:hypothetical protein BGZ79_005273 [Entomortierella chlamydospora]|nr:hypothetical protein BGZ79_005273 [Entomortierella chlamydospora]